MNENELNEFLVGDSEAGQRLDVFIAAQLTVSRGRAQKLLETTTVNGAPAKAKYTVKTGDKVLVTGQLSAVSETAPNPESDSLNPLPAILFEDEHLIILNKPSGVVVHAGAGETGATLVDILRAHGKTLSSVGPQERGGIVHRLDKETSGVMVVCKTDAAHWKLASDFAERRVRKEYAAIVNGVPRGPGRVEAPIFRHPQHRKKMAVVATGRPAISEYSVEKSWPKFALLNVNILTGRTHQIRVHLSYVNHAVVGDELYGGLHRALMNAPTDEVREAMKTLSGQALHAHRLAFAHPVTGEDLKFETPLPEEMNRVLEALDNAME